MKRWSESGLVMKVALRGEFGLNDGPNLIPRGATDGSLPCARGMDRVVGVAGGGDRGEVALAVAGGDAGDVVRRWAANRDDVAAGREVAGRLSRPRPLPADRRSPIAGDRTTAARTGAVAGAEARVARAAGPRRFAHQALRPEGRRGRHPSRSDARSDGKRVLLRTHLGHAGGERASRPLGSDRPADLVVAAVLF